MAYLALYRKYRPETFDKLIGQDHIVKTLVNQIESGRLGHAYLFTGSRGTGKTSAAKIFAKAINCQSPVNGSPCGHCEACRALSDPSNIDVIEIDAASNNGVNEIRELREKVQYPPVSCAYKVYIVDEVHMLTGAAFNALLKTLEEPPRHAVFILATTEVHKIPATILSRCMRFDFRLIPAARIARLIANIYDETGKEYDKEAVLAIAAAGEGSIRDALSIADIALSYGKGKLTYDDVMDIIGSSNSEILLDFVKDMLDGDTGGVLDTVNKMSSLGKSMGMLIKDVSAVLRNLIVVRTCSDPNSVLSLPEDKFAALRRVAEGAECERLLRMLDIFSDAENNLKYTNHPRIVFETAAVKAARPSADYDISALLARVKELENKVQKLTEALDGANKPYLRSTADDSALSSGNNTETDNGKALSGNSKISSENTEKSAEAPALTAVREGGYGESADSVKNGGSVKKSVQSVSSEQLKGILLYNLRNNDNEMLWNVMQSVGVEASGNVITLTAESSGDAELLDMYDNKNCIEEALSEFLPFELQIRVSPTEKKLEEIDEETEKVKKIFGDDIVIVKD